MSDGRVLGTSGRFCTSCGTEIRSGSQFCVNCGANLSPNQESTEPGSVSSGPSLSDRLGSMMGSMGAAFSRLRSRLTRASSNPSGNTWRGTPGRLLGWFQDLPSIPKIVVIGVLVVLLLAPLSPMLRIVAVLVMAVSAVVLIIRAIQSKPVALWGTVALASLILIPVFGITSNAFYGGGSNFFGQGSAVSNQYGVVDQGSGEMILPGNIASVLPEGWDALPSESGEEHKVTLVPSTYSGDTDDDLEIASDQAIINFYRQTSPSCDVQNDKVTESDAWRENIYAGYEDAMDGSGTMASGEASLGGEDATWIVDYLAFAVPWRYDDTYYPYEVASPYPMYHASVFLNVCSEELGLKAEFFITEKPFGSSSASDINSIEPTFNNNASVSATRLETRDTMRRRYEENIGTLIEVLENAEGSSWWNRTDLSEIPTTLEGVDEELEDPFKGELNGTIE